MLSEHDKSRFSIKYFEKRDSFILVDLRGIEPLTSRLRTWRSPS